MRFVWLVLAAVLASIASLARAETLKQVMGAPHRQRVYDYAGVLSKDERVRLRGQLLGMEQRHAAQGAVIVLRRVEGTTIERFAQEIGNRWGVGERGKNNGFVIVVALEQRKWRLQTGKGLRNRISAAAAGQLMRDAVVPYFREKQYAVGLATALSAIDQKVSGRAAPVAVSSAGTTGSGYSYSPSYSGSSGSGWNGLFLLFGVFAFVIIVLAAFGQAAGTGGRSGRFGVSPFTPHHPHHHSGTHIPHDSGTHTPPPVDTSPPPSGGGDYGGGSQQGGGGASGGW